MDLQDGANLIGVLLVWGAPVVLILVMTIRFVRNRQRSVRRQRAREARESSVAKTPQPESENPGTPPARWSMRRSKRAVRDAGEIDRILGSATVCRLALTADNEPYLVTLSYGLVGTVAEGMRWDEEALCFLSIDVSQPLLYFHSAHDGRKMEMIRRNPRVCFEVTGEWKTVSGEKACGWTARYESVVGYGDVVEVTDEEEKRAGLTAVLRQSGATGAIDLPSGALSGTSVLRLSVSELSGKSNWSREEANDE